MAQAHPSFGAVAHEQAVVAHLTAAGCVFAEDEARHLVRAARSHAELDRLVERRVSGEPLEVVIGWAEFCGRRISLDSGVFVPRRRTEFLTRQACRVLHAGDTALDMCCGSGAVGAVIQTMIENVEVYAADVDVAAVKCARRNIGAPDRVFEGDLFDPLPLHLRERLDVIVANAPYVPTASIRLMPPEARLHEPLASLDGGPDGLDIQRRIIADASPWLRPGGHLLVETSAHQMHTTVEIFRSEGYFTQPMHYEDTASTVVIGRLDRPV